MKNGTGFAIVVVIGYIGLEGYAVHKASYRTEPAYIHNMLVEAKTAVQACAGSTSPDVEGFNRSLTRVTQKYKREIGEKTPSKSVKIIDQEVADKAAATQMTIEAFIAEKGCGHQEVKNHLRRFDIYARKS